MARSSSSSSNSSSSSSNVKKSTKTIDKFASKYVGTILSDIIEKKKATIKKNPKTTAKWLSKMQISIQRKVCNASMLAFQSKSIKEATPESLKLEITKIQATIDKQISNIREKAKTLSKKSDLKNLKEASITYNQGKFDERVRNISDQFGQIAHQLDSVAKDMQNRIQLISNSLLTVESSWVPPPVPQGKANNNTSQKVSNSKVTTSSSAKDGPLKSLATHLKN